MLTNDAFTQLLNLPKPWLIERIEIATTPEEVHVWVVHGRGPLVCPTCQSLCPVHDHANERIWRHLDLWKAQTFIHARLPRVRGLKGTQCAGKSRRETTGASPPHRKE